jgi:hypothetical protein
MISRRGLLALSAAGAALVPFVPLLEREASAAGGTCKRLVVFHTPNGSILRNWRPSGSGANWQLSEILQPLAAFKDRMIVLDGLDNLPGSLAATGDVSMIGKGHHASGSVLTQYAAVSGDGGAICNNDAACDWPAGPSFDQYIVKRLQESASTATLFGSITPGVSPDGALRQYRVFYNEDGQPVNPEGNPQKLFDALFADALLDPAEKARLKRERQSVIDVVKGELDSVKGKLGAHDRTRLDAHLEGVLQLEKIVNGTIGECSIPPSPETGEWTYAQLNGNDTMPALTELQFEIAAHALACDMTRVVSFQWGREGSTGVATWLGQNEGIHTISHWEGATQATAIQWMTDLNAWFAEKLAAFLTRLEELGALDDTLILWTQTMCEGATHNACNLPTVMVQGQNGYFQTNRYLRYGDFPSVLPTSIGAANTPQGGESLNRLWTSVCHAMGFNDVDCFGDPDFGTGTLPGL